MVQYKQYQTKKGNKWMYRPYIYDKKTGKKKKTTRRGFRTKRDAEQDYARLCLGLNQAEITEEEKPAEINFWNVLDEWWEDYKASGVKENTIYTRETGHLPHISKRFGHKDIADITISEYEKFLNDLKRNGFSKGYIRSINSVMNMIMNYAVKQGVLDQNILLYARFPLFSKSVDELKLDIEDMYLTSSELRTFLEVASKKYSIVFETLFYLLAYTGMRIGEALALEFTDFDMQKKQVKIYKTLYQRGNTSRYEITTPKTTSSVRTIELNDKIIDKIILLKKYISSIKKEVEFVEGKDFCFVMLKNRFWGCPLTVEAVNIKIKAVAKSMNLTKKVTSHIFRHTHVSLLAQKNIPLNVIRERVGHGAKGVTEKVYLHVTTEQKVEVINKLEELF